MSLRPRTLFAVDVKVFFLLHNRARSRIVPSCFERAKYQISCQRNVFSPTHEPPNNGRATIDGHKTIMREDMGSRSDVFPIRIVIGYRRTMRAQKAPLRLIKSDADADRCTRAACSITLSPAHSICQAAAESARKCSRAGSSSPNPTRHKAKRRRSEIRCEVN